MENYFVINNETGKLELHFEKDTYKDLPDDKKAEIKGAFLWGRNSGCWISRRKEPNLWYPLQVARSLGLEDAGKQGERLSFAEQMERKAERAERRADRYEDRADAAEKRGEALQAPINKMHGDIAFFTQPNINTSAGRAFTNRRNKMFASFEKGFEEFRKSAYWSERAETARATAAQEELKDRGFIQRRIDERESSIRKLKKNIEEDEKVIAAIEKGETPRNRYGWEDKRSAEKVQESLEHWLDRLEVVLDELGFYMDCMEQAGGVTFSRENIKPGYIVSVRRHNFRDVGEVLSTGPKNAIIKCGQFPLKYSYADIEKVIKAEEKKPDVHPYKVGETFTCNVWDSEARERVKKEFKIIRVTDKSVTLQAGDEKPFNRKPTLSRWADRSEWYLSIDSSYGCAWRKAAEKVQPEPEQAASMTPEEFAATIQ